MNERDFYNPIKKYFEETIANNLGAHIKLLKTHDPIPKDIGFGHPGIIKILKFYSYEPDLIGVVRVKGGKYKKRNKVMVIKIKTEPFKLSDFYHLRLFSEIIESDFSFLVSPYDVAKKIEDSIKGDNKKYFKNYYLKPDGKVITREIIVGKITCEKEKNKMKIDKIDFDTPFIL